MYTLNSFRIPYTIYKGIELKGQTSNDFGVPNASSPPPYSIVLGLYSHSVLNDIDRLLQQLQTKHGILAERIDSYER